MSQAPARQQATHTDTLEVIARFFDLDLSLVYNGAMTRFPIDIPNVGRNDLARLFQACGFTNGAEIGVEQGVYAAVLCQSNPGLHLYAVDAWQAYAGYRDHVSQSKLDGFFATTQNRLQAYRVTYLREFSVTAATRFADASLDFVFIDANHEFFHVVEDLRAWMPKVRPGGIVAGHDFCRRKQNGYQVHVVEAVTAYTGAYQIRPWFVLGSKAVREGDTRDRPRSWFWVQA